MMKVCKPTNHPHRGLTLIEVVAGLALMGTLLAAMLTAKGRFTQQQHRAQRVLAAVDALDALLINHWDEFVLLDRGTTGELPGIKDMSWRASFIDNGAARDWHGRVLRVEVLDRADAAGNEVLAGVELLLIDPAYLNQNVKSGRAEQREESPNGKHEQKHEPVIPVDEQKPSPVVLGVTP